MSAHQDLTTVLNSVLTLLAPSPVPVTVDTLWHLMEILAKVKFIAAAHAMLYHSTMSMKSIKKIFNAF